MNRKEFLERGSLLVAVLASGREAAGAPSPGAAVPTSQGKSGPGPLAITMWDFSWIERRWPGAGYEDWDRVLDELVTRGYNAVRIDAFPHLVAYGPERLWTLKPVWNQQDWGSPALNRIRIQPELNEFIGRCRARGIWVALSTWFRRDTDESWRKVDSPPELGRIWCQTLDSIAADGLLDSILYVDFCNEYPLAIWAPWFSADSPVSRRSPEGKRWMTEAIETFRARYPNIPCTFSFTTEYEDWQKEDVSFLDFLELHLWMTHFCDFYTQVGYHYERFDSRGYENLVRNGERLYRERPDYWRSRLEEGIERAADWSRSSEKPLITTECWGIVDYKDWPLLHWDWIKELCEAGVRKAASTGRWVSMATSNFCGPQFVGMWRDVDWHRRLTGLIREAPLAANLSDHPLVRRIRR